MKKFLWAALLLLVAVVGGPFARALYESAGGDTDMTEFRKHCETRMNQCITIGKQGDVYLVEVTGDNVYLKSPKGTVETFDVEGFLRSQYWRGYNATQFTVYPTDERYKGLKELYLKK